MKAIVVIDKNRAIGKSGDLLFHLPTDLAHFKRETLGKCLIMGRKTLESMPGGKPLKGRSTMVLSKLMDEGQIWTDGEYECRCFKYFARLATYVHFRNDVVVCGGGQIYDLFLPMCDELVITEVEAEAEGADTFFPEYKNEFTMYQEEGPFVDGDLTYYIRRYRRNG